MSEKAAPLSLLEAVESGDVLEILKAQRRIIAEKMVNAAENTAPQYSNELSKLTDRITAEEARRAAAAEEVAGQHDAATDESFDASAV